MSEPCTETERIGVISVKLENIEKSLEKQEKSHNQLHEKLDAFIEKADDKYATRKELYWLVPICGFAVVGFLFINNIV